MRLVRLTQLKIGETTSACCAKTVLLVRKMDTGVNTAVQTRFYTDRTGVASER